MKKLVIITLVVAMLLVVPMSAYAVPANTSISRTIVFEDGSYIITTISEEPSPRKTVALLEQKRLNTIPQGTRLSGIFPLPAPLLMME